jgi:hypothetical protein
MKYVLSAFGIFATGKSGVNKYCPSVINTPALPQITMFITKKKKNGGFDQGVTSLLHKSSKKDFHIIRVI